ncbi:hypothetical protein F9B52_11430 [Staphylococcus epidermidis]|nr:hypothetical protein F9B46_12615 [Staphylococcus epidermidis]KAB2271110.1 hypothetical protein F9B52_11430 [Staphylococcus epidermidis]KAB2293670.1 hypothetical protein F9B69_12360 [Staphylococcus epidermidis]PIH06266.1 hypothetical protein CTJ00_13720 [Staphylococcus epidermidis]
MKILIYGLNTLNYIILLLLILLNLHNLQQIGLNICEYFLLSSIGILIISLIIYFFKKKEIFLVSVFINFLNIAIIFPILLLSLF